MCVESARPIRSANGRVPGDRDFASCTPAEAWDARPILSGCRVWAPVIFPADLAIHPATLDCLPVVFFQPIASPRTSECHIGSPVWFLNRRPTHPRGEFAKKKKVESKKRSFGVQTKPVETRRVSKPARYRESGLGQRVVPRLSVRATRGREKASNRGL